MNYSFRDLLAAYRKIGVRPGDTVYVLTALWRVADFEKRGTDALVQAHLDALREVIGADGTIVVSTGTLNLCNTDIPFDVGKTASYNRGLISEYIRQLPEARRSFHPFGSYAAIGPEAESITAHTSRHVYGPETPEARMIERDAITVNIGLPPNVCSTVHHVEQLMAVPYRYSKEFMHPVVRNGRVNREPFYMYVWYRGIGVERSYNKKLFARLRESNSLDIAEASIGRGRITAYRMAEFTRAACNIFADNIYIWCDHPPEQRPYRD